MVTAEDIPGPRFLENDAIAGGSDFTPYWAAYRASRRDIEASALIFAALWVELLVLALCGPASDHAAD